MQFLKTRVTRLLMQSPPRDRVTKPADGRAFEVRHVPNIPLGFYRYLYDAVGKPHHWTSRLLPDALLDVEVHGPGVGVFVLYVDSAPAGWFEIAPGRNRQEKRLVHFALLPDFRGQGLARYLLSEAIAAAFDGDIDAMTVETNTLDHEAALPLYRKMGFRDIGVREVTTPSIES